MSTPGRTLEMHDSHPENLTTSIRQTAGCQAIMNYELLSSLTGQMREAAIQGEWDKLVEIEKQRSQQVALLKQMDATASLDEHARQRKIQLINKILDDDAKVRNCTETWMEQLQRDMRSNRQEHHLQQAYGSL